MTRARQRLGASGEERAARWYTEAGYEILDRNWRCPDGELDLVAAADGVLVFAEVKTRRSTAFGTPAEAVTPAKQRRVRRLAVVWLSDHDRRAPELRFDVVAVTGDDIEVIEAAF